MDTELYHYGMPRRSGRYPWGSGEDPYQSAVGWRGYIQELKKQGFSDVQIAEMEGITTTKLRARNALVKDEIRAAQRAEVIRLSEKGMSNMEIGRRMNINESQVRGLKDPILAERASLTVTVANMLKENVDEKRFIDIGAGVENHVGVTRTRLNTAVAALEEQGYKVHRVNVGQVGMPGQFTIVKVLGAPDTEWKEIVNDVGKIKNITVISDDFGRTYRSNLGLEPIESISSKRIKVQYGEEGKAKDGIIELRKGAKDLDMGGSKYAQVRIGVDGKQFLKGMAIYNDNMPEGVDIIFNTNKHDTGDKKDALKTMKADMNDPKVKEIKSMGLSDVMTEKMINKGVREGTIKVDPDNPFGSTIKEGGQRGALNIVNEEGDWSTWSKTISSQVLSKQTVPVAKKQLDLAYSQKKEEYDELLTLTNPAVQKQLLLAFADDCDASAVHLKAAGLPRQASKVILPIPSIKPTEVYAPTFKDGESVVLIRHPHGGTFEIPQVTVNNKSKEAQAIMKNAPDAIGIHPSVAQKLSGADFDGDTVIVIPNNKGLIKTSASLKGLENFDPIESYKIPKDSNVKPIKPRTKQTEMGKVSNLITDMTIKGANLDEIARAVRHSMVVIDSEKHDLDYRQSYIDNGISALASKYQTSMRGGASTIISKAGSEIRIPQRKPRPAAEGGPIDPKTGKKIYVDTGASYINKKGKEVMKTSTVSRMEKEENAFTLSSGRQIEEVYAKYANDLKALANDSRKKAVSSRSIPYSTSANQVYKQEVKSLNDKLSVALRNKPLERQAQIVANSIVARKKEANPNMDYDDIQKISNQALAEARVRTGANKKMIDISEKEWDAIQAGAITPSKLTQVLQNSKLDRVKELATPRDKPTMSSGNISRAKSLLNSGATLAEVAEILGVSVTTLTNAIK